MYAWFSQRMWPLRAIELAQGLPLHRKISDVYGVEDFKYNEQMTFVETVSNLNISIISINFST